MTRAFFGHQGIFAGAAFAAALAVGLAFPAAAEDQLAFPEVGADSFGCIMEMTPVRGFFVDNLLDNLEATLAVAQSPDGGTYPPGSVVQLVPSEVMVKREAGWSPDTNDWEFFELEVSGSGSAIRVRGTTDVINRFGGNCLDCHSAAEPQWDMICEQDHGCAPVPLTREQIVAIQEGDPRCTAELVVD